MDKAVRLKARDGRKGGWARVQAVVSVKEKKEHAPHVLLCEAQAGAINPSIA